MTTKTALRRVPCLLLPLLASCVLRDAERFPLGPEMAQLEKDLASPAYRDTVLSMKNHNDLDGEILRIDVPDNARRFAARHSAVAHSSTLTAAHERRLAIEREFLGLIREGYRRIGMEERFERQLEGLFTEGDAVQSSRAASVEAVSIEAILPAPGAESQWPRWRGPRGDGRSEETGLPLAWSAEENVAWKTEVPGQGNSSPIIWGDRIFLTAASDAGRRRGLVSVRRGDGELLWVADAPFIEPESRVRSKNGYASATPVTDGERVIAFFGNTGLVAFDFAGDLVWHVPFEPFDAMHGTGASPVLWGDLAILLQEQSNGPAVGIAVGRRNGEVRWRLEGVPAALGWCTPALLRVGGRDELIWGSSHTLRAFDPGTGAELWRCGGPTREVIPTVVHGHGLVYSCSGRNGPTIAIRPGGDGDVSATHVAWKVVRGGPHVPSPVLSGDLLYLVNDTGILTCLEAVSGKTVYQRRLGGAFSASPLAADGRIYVTSEEGDTFVVRDGREFELLAANPIGEPVLASLAVLDRTIYLRGERRLFAIR